ncbi:MAG: hypothetical protein AAF629_12015 [Chloroflexota bacterium]
MSLSFDPKQKLESWVALLILSLSSLAVIWVGINIWQHQNLNDDSFITLTYAKNLAAGRGFVYNHGPATLGTTTPFFTFVVALMAIILPVLSIAQHAILLSIICWIGAGWLLYAIFRQQTISPLAAALAASIPLLTSNFWVGLVGMEIWLFQCLLTLSIYFTLKHKDVYAGACIAALFLTRGEGALVGLILGIYLWYRSGKLPVAFSVTAGSLVLTWIFYALMTFGTFIPNTLRAKQVQAQLPNGRDFFDRIAFDLVPQYLGLFNLFERWTLNPMILLIGIGLIYIGLKKQRLLLFIAWLIAYVGGYTLLNPSPYFWYVLHIVFIFLVLAGLGLASLVMQFQAWFPKSRSFIVASIILVLFGTMLYFSQDLLRHRLPLYTGYERGEDYRAITTWLREHTQPEESIAFMEIGYLGYFTENRIIDLAGLIDPTITDHVLDEGFTWGFYHYQPDYYLYADEFDWAMADLAPPLDGYILVHQLERKSQPTPLYVYKRIE